MASLFWLSMKGEGPALLIPLSLGMKESPVDAEEAVLPAILLPYFRKLFLLTLNQLFFLLATRNESFALSKKAFLGGIGFEH